MYFRLIFEVQEYICLYATAQDLQIQERRLNMDYKKGYAILMKEISDTIDVLQSITPKTFEIHLTIKKLQTALLDVEKMYLDSVEKMYLDDIEKIS